MSDNEHWMDRIWREKGHKVSWLIVPSTVGAVVFVISMMAMTFDHMNTAIWLLGVLAVCIALVGVGFLLDNQRD